MYHICLPWKIYTVYNVCMCMIFHLLKLVLLVILNSPSKLLKDTCIVYIMSDWREIVSTEVRILSCDSPINITSLIFCTIASSVINIWVVVGYSPGQSSLTCGWSILYYIAITIINYMYIRIDPLCMHKHLWQMNNCVI